MRGRRPGQGVAAAGGPTTCSPSWSLTRSAGDGAAGAEADRDAGGPEHAGRRVGGCAAGRWLRPGRRRGRAARRGAAATRGARSASTRLLARPARCSPQRAVTKRSSSVGSATGAPTRTDSRLVAPRGPGQRRAAAVRMVSPVAATAIRASSTARRAPGRPAPAPAGSRPGTGRRRPLPGLVHGVEPHVGLRERAEVWDARARPDPDVPHPERDQPHLGRPVQHIRVHPGRQQRRDQRRVDRPVHEGQVPPGLGEHGPPDRRGEVGVSGSACTRPLCRRDRGPGQRRTERPGPRRGGEPGWAQEELPVRILARTTGRRGG